MGEQAYLPMGCGTVVLESCIAKAYFRAVRAKVSVLRKFAAVLVAAVLALALQPAALAMPAPHSAPMQAMHHASHGKVCCDHSMPQRNRDMPCKDMANCLGMLSCIALAAVPHNAATIAPHAPTATQSWRLYDIGPGITLQPDNPPPIA